MGEDGFAGELSRGAAAAGAGVQPEAVSGDLAAPGMGGVPGGELQREPRVAAEGVRVRRARGRGDVLRLRDRARFVAEM